MDWKEVATTVGNTALAINPITAPFYLGWAIFGSDDLTEVHKALPIYLAVKEGTPEPLFTASRLADEHSRKQDEFAVNADKLRLLLDGAWRGEAAEKANKKIKKLAEEARKTSQSLQQNAQSFHNQGNNFSDLRKNMKHMDDPPPEGAGFLDRLAPWDTAAEEAVERNQEAARHNLALYEKYEKTTKSNAEQLTDKYGNAGNPGQQNNPYQYDPNQHDEQRRRMEEEARRRQEEAQRQADEARRRMEEEARRRQEETRRQAEEARRRMEEEARRQREAAEEQARRAREALRTSSFSPGEFKPGEFKPGKFGGTSASSFSPSDFAGSGVGGGAGSLSPGAFGGSGAASGAPTGDGRASGAVGFGSGAAGGAAAAAAGRAAGMGGMRGGMPMGMMGGAGAAGNRGEDKQHKRKYMATEDPNKLFGTDEKSVPPVIGDK